MNRRLIFAGIAVALLAIWFFFLYQPALQRQHQLTAQMAEARAQLDDFNVTLSQVPVYIKTRDELAAKLKDASAHLYGKSDLMRLFTNLREAASSNGIRVDEITPPVNELLDMNKIAPGSTEPLFLTVTVTLEGNFLAFGRFVETIEREPYFRAVKSCVVTSLQDGSGRISYSLSFKALLGGIPEEA